MRKFLTAIAVALACSAGAQPAHAESNQVAGPEVRGWAGGIILHEVEGETAVEDDQVEAAPGGARLVGQRPVWYAFVPTVVTQPDGSRCARNIRYRFADPAAAAAAANIRQNYAWLVTVGGWLPCQTADAPPAAPTPSEEAVSFWRVAGEDLLPKPAPHIAPGYMLAGKMAYLEAGSQSTARFEHPTPLGTLVIEATSRLMVDWGDGSGVTGPHTGPGGPWPDGNITHFWTTAATYDVRVVQRWTGRWSLAGAAGPLDGLETEGVIDDFEVRQLQAVRNR